MSGPAPGLSRQTPLGWADERLRQAYDLIHETWAEHVMADDDLPEIQAALRAVEEADQTLSGIIKGRVS